MQKSAPDESNGGGKEEEKGEKVVEVTSLSALGGQRLQSQDQKEILI